MSTKIYNAYVMKSISIKRMDDFIRILRKECIKRGKEKLNKMAASMAMNIIDTGCICRSLPEYASVLYRDIKKYVINLYKDSKESVDYVLNQRNAEYDEAEIIKSLKIYRHLNVGHISAQIVLNKSGYADAEKTIQYSEYDVSSSIVLFPTGKRILFMVFGDILQDLLQDILSSGEDSYWENFRQTYQIRDYHYQNQTDRPDDVSLQDWNRRKLDWDSVMPSGVPSKDGLVINVTDSDTFWREMLFQDAGNLIPYIKPVKERAECIAKEITILKDIPKDIKMYECMSIIHDKKRELKDARSKTFKEYVKCRDLLEKILVNIQIKELEKQVTEYYDL